jgi:hypothetical protein
MSFYGVTFSGVDESVHPAQLLEVRSHYFPVEWGINFTREHQKTRPPFPGIDWIKGFHPAANLSAHLQGKFARDFLEGEDGDFVRQYGDVLPLFRRIQVRCDVGADQIDWKRLTQIANNYPDKKLTVQISAENSEMIDSVAQLGVPISILFDRGSSDEAHWPKAQKGLKGCGYAGNLRPDNLSKQLSLLMAAARHAEYWWIDLGASVRTIENGKDLFNCDLCKKVIREVEGYFLDYVI